MLMPENKQLQHHLAHVYHSLPQYWCSEWKSQDQIDMTNHHFPVNYFLHFEFEKEENHIFIRFHFETNPYISKNTIENYIKKHPEFETRYQEFIDRKEIFRMHIHQKIRNSRNLDSNWKTRHDLMQIARYQINKNLPPHEIARIGYEAMINFTNEIFDNKNPYII